MRYSNIIEGEFISRENRFIALVSIGGEAMRVHVKNTGRCKELLLPGSKVYLVKSDKEGRRTAYDLVAVEKKCDGGTILINMDSMIPNDAVAEWLPASGLFSPSATVKREYTYHDSRFDFFVVDGDRRALIEVKGVTLENNRRVMFPDAPTERGAKHLRGLVRAVEEGFEAYVIFVVQMDSALSLSPNTATDPEFSRALVYANKMGVRLCAYKCKVTPLEMLIDKPIEIILPSDGQI